MIDTEIVVSQTKAGRGRPMFSPVNPSVIERRLVELGGTVVQVDLTTVDGVDGILGALSCALVLPAGVDTSWSTFETSLSETVPSGTVMIMTGWYGRLKRMPGMVLGVAHVLAGISERFEAGGKTLEFVWVR